MNAVQECLKVTKRLYDIVMQSKEAERDEYIHQVNTLLEKRQAFITQIKPPFTVEEEQIGKQLIAWNKVIDTQLETIMLEVQSDIQGVNKKKTSMQKYINPYEALQLDGAFYDKKN